MQKSESTVSPVSTQKTIKTPPKKKKKQENRHAQKGPWPKYFRMASVKKAET